MGEKGLTQDEATQEGPGSGFDGLSFIGDHPEVMEQLLHRPTTVEKKADDAQPPPPTSPGEGPLEGPFPGLDGLSYIGDHPGVVEQLTHEPPTTEKKPNWGLREGGNTAVDYNHPGVKATWDPNTGVWRDPDTGKPAVGIPFVLVESTDGSSQPYVYNLKKREKLVWNKDIQGWSYLIESEDDERNFWASKQ